MIFVTIGTHPQGFERLIKKIDEIAPFIKEKIIVQKGFTDYNLKNTDYFDFTDDINKYYKNARLIISHSATSVLEISMKYKKPLIIVPRQKKYNEHINNHQIEFSEYFSKITGTPSINSIDDLTPELLKKHKKVPNIKENNLKKLQDYFKNLFKDLENEKTAFC